MLTQEELRISPLFRDISYESYLAMYDCFHAVNRAYRPDDIICDFSDGCNAVGIIERGEAVVVRIDSDGVETVMETLSAGGVFGRSLAFSGKHTDTMEVLCRTGCDVLFIGYDQIIKRCENACTHHSILVQNMLQLIADKAQSLSERVDVLSRRSIREKLVCYFAQQAAKTGTDRFALPFSLSMLADYLATDRSAMMRELKKLREDGTVETQNRTVVFHPELQ